MASVGKALHWDVEVEFRVWSLMLLSHKLLMEPRESPPALLLAMPWPPGAFAHQSPRVSPPASLLSWNWAAAGTPDAVPGRQPAPRRGNICAGLAVVDGREYFVINIFTAGLVKGCSNGWVLGRQ